MHWTVYLKSAGRNEMLPLTSTFTFNAIFYVRLLNVFYTRNRSAARVRTTSRPSAVQSVIKTAPIGGAYFCQPIHLVLHKDVVVSHNWFVWSLWIIPQCCARWQCTARLGTSDRCLQLRIATLTDWLNEWMDIKNHAPRELFCTYSLKVLVWEKSVYCKGVRAFSQAWAKAQCVRSF